MTSFLVTGAAGFIGSHVAEALLAGGHQVVGLDNFDDFYPRPVKEANLARALASAAFRLVEGDVRDAQLLSGLIRADTVVVHLAARAGVRPSIELPELYTSANVLGTMTVLETARRAGARRVIFAGSSSVYGDTSPVPFSEDWPAIAPISPYAATKRAGELLCGTYAHLYPMRIIALRFFTVYGPRQRPDLAIHKFARLIAEGRPVPFFGDGSTERDYTYIDDIVGGVLGAVDWTGVGSAGEGAFEIVNLGESRTTRLDRLVELISAALAAEGLPATPVLERHPAQPGDVRRTCADISKARRLLGYAPTTAVEEGIPRFVRWFKEAHGRSA
ncbi:MAG: GDP-mannose 4,6-dehydratase [Gemmatimonadota bacterium]